ncbi:MAG: hypothetical protein L3J97_04500, partial [Thermoplasmata archaeon]|nr:hypothetical protein [Thermoplasmata archaeon]
ALMTSSMWVDRTEPEQLRRALVAKTMYQHIAEMLDDLIDTGEYSRSAASRLYCCVLLPLGQPRIDTEKLRGRMLKSVTRSGAPMVDPLVELAAQLHHEIGRAPRALGFRELFSLGNRFLSHGQPLTVLLQGRRLDVPAVRGAARHFYAPSAEVDWVTRLAKYMSHASNLALLDLYFVRPSAPMGDLNEHLWTWYYLDALISIMDHLADLEADSRAGIVNLALLGMRPQGPKADEVPLDSFRGLGVDDFDCLLEQMADLSTRALMHAEWSGMAAPRFYRLLTLLVPVVMLSSGKDGGRSLLPAYLEKLATRLSTPGSSGRRRPIPPPSPSRALYYQETRYSQHSAPVRTQDVFTTVPATPRADMIPS